MASGDKERISTVTTAGAHEYITSTVSWMTAEAYEQSEYVGWDGHDIWRFAGFRQVLYFQEYARRTFTGCEFTLLLDAVGVAGQALDKKKCRDP